MGLAGTGAVAIWHDIAPEGRAEFYRWHGHEHMPERVGIPGFLRGRRYIALDGTPEYFNLYETQSPATLTGPDYQERLNHPTQWTTATVKHFRGVARSLCAVAGSLGVGQGGLIATFRYAVDGSVASTHRQRMIASALPTIAAAPGVAGCHLLIADEAASAAETEEKKVRAEKNLIPRWILLIESWDDAKPFTAFCRAQLDGQLFADADGAPALGIYTLQNSRGKTAQGAP